MPPRIAPLDAPYEEAVAQTLAKWMPTPGIPALALFRTIARHPMLRERMRPLGAGLLGHGTLPARVRELVILRTSARCDARYEWGVHVTAFAAAAGLDRDTIRATALATPDQLAHRDDDDAIVMRIADELHDRATLSPALFDAAVARFGAEGALELAVLAGYYHVISYVISVAGVEPEPWAEPFPTRESL
jgi:4-carboxymuconolactone decarboxylase